MSRSEAIGNGKAIAFGVDTMIEPGTIHTYVQVWDTSEEAEPCNEGPEGFNNILVEEHDIPEERVVALALQHGIPLEVTRVWKAFD